MNSNCPTITLQRDVMRSGIIVGSKNFLST